MLDDKEARAPEAFITDNQGAPVGLDVQETLQVVEGERKKRRDSIRLVRAKLGQENNGSESSLALEAGKMKKDSEHREKERTEKVPAGKEQVDVQSDVEVRGGSQKKKKDPDDWEKAEAARHGKAIEV